MKLLAIILAAFLALGGLSAVIGTSLCGQIGAGTGLNAEWDVIQGCRLEVRPGFWTPVQEIQVEQSA